VSPVIDVVAPRLLAPAIMLAAALIVKGYTDAGEGFSAGVIVALADALRYVVLGQRRGDRSIRPARHAHLIAAVGLLIAIACGFGSTLIGEPPFTHLPLAGEPVVHVGTLELTTAVGFDVGLFMLVSGSLVMLVRHLTGLIEGDDVTDEPVAEEATADDAATADGAGR
jgi:multisubunit Na+/H+ antiporter MnhB subunit